MGRGCDERACHSTGQKVGGQQWDDELARMGPREVSEGPLEWKEYIRSKRHRYQDG